MATREEMLERIRRALGRPPGGGNRVPPTTDSLAEKLDDVLPPVKPEDLVPKFEEELRKVGGSAYRASTLSELEEIVGRILEDPYANAVVLSRNRLLAELKLGEKLRAWGKSVAVWPAAASAPALTADQGQAVVQFSKASFSATVGVTGVDFALAETGSLVLSSQTEGSQLASLAPPVHVALYRRSQVLGSLDELLERLAPSHDPNQPSPGRSVVFITGTSRTADIEQVLIRGVHGPGEVHAILVEESCLV